LLEAGRASTFLSASDWEPVFQKALREYASEQRGGMMIINVRSLMKHMIRSSGYPKIEAEDEAVIRGYLARFLSELFGPLWDGVKYRKRNKSLGKSLMLGTDNVIDMCVLWSVKK
jgi:hypothetical protein